MGNREGIVQTVEIKISFNLLITEMIHVESETECYRSYEDDFADLPNLHNVYLLYIPVDRKMVISLFAVK